MRYLRDKQCEVEDDALKSLTVVFVDSNGKRVDVDLNPPARKPRVIEHQLNPMTATLPLCKACNSDFGEGLKEPVAQIFEDLEHEKGVAILRPSYWCDGFGSWRGLDGYFSSLKGGTTILCPIDAIRGQLTLAIALVKEINPNYSDAQLGIDSRCQHNAIL